MINGVLEFIIFGITLRMAGQTVRLMVGMKKQYDGEKANQPDINTITIEE